MSNEVVQRSADQQVAATVINKIITDVKCDYLKNEKSGQAFALLEKKLEESFEPKSEQRSPSIYDNGNTIVTYNGYKPKADVLNDAQSAFVYVLVKTEQRKINDKFVETEKTILLSDRDINDCPNAISWTKSGNDYTLRV